MVVALVKLSVALAMIAFSAVLIAAIATGADIMVAIYRAIIGSLFFAGFGGLLSTLLALFLSDR